MRLCDLIEASGTFSVLDEQSGSRVGWAELPAIDWGDRRRSLVFLYSDNSFQDVCFLLACLRTNHVLALLPRVMEHSLKERLESLYRPAFVYDRTRSSLPGFVGKHERLYARVGEDVEDPTLHPDLRMLLSTSGTTGSPKFVKLSERNLVSNARSICEYLPIAPTDIVPLNLPIHYSYGLSVLTSHAVMGATVSCTDNDIVTRGFWDAFQRHGYSSIAGVPFVYEMLERIGFLKFDLPSLKYLTQAGGKLRKELVVRLGEYAREKGKSFYVMYGQTEATARMSYLPPKDVLEKPGSVGIAIPGGRFELDPETTELIYHGDNVCGGYAVNSSDLSTFDDSGILRTGDLAEFDADGYLYIKGRLRRFVKLFGNRMNLDEVETAIADRFHCRLPCIGWDDKRLVIFHNDESLSIQEVAADVSARFRIHPSAIRTMHVDAYPFTANGKIDYTALTMRYDKG